MAHTIAVAIAVKVNDDGRIDYSTAAALVQHVVEQAFTSPIGSPQFGVEPVGVELVAYCQHDQHEVLFHEDGPCPPIGETDFPPAVCECGGFGYLTEQTYGRTTPPDEAIIIQRCDSCERYDGDLDAAVGYASAEAAHRRTRMEVHVIGDGDIMAPYSDAWVIEGDPRLAGITGPIWHTAEEAARMGFYNWVGRCIHCADGIAFLDTSPPGTQVWIDDAGGVYCTNSVEPRHHEYEPEST